MLPPQSGLGRWRDAGKLRMLVASFNARFKDDSCDGVLAEIRNNPDQMVYSSLDLSMARAQSDRYFPYYPKSGRELLAKKYVSEPIILE